MQRIHKLQYITQGSNLAEQEANVVRALESGVKWIQVRWKNASREDFITLAQRIKTYCISYGAICIINDHIDVAQLVDADGVHLGLQDSSIEEARTKLGTHKIIGGTANTIADIQQRITEGCDYIGLGPLRFTPTKEKLSPILGIGGYSDVLHQLSSQSEVPPLIAIGGIALDDIAPLLATGIHGIAVSSLITQTPHLTTTINSLLQ